MSMNPSPISNTTLAHPAQAPAPARRLLRLLERLPVGQLELRLPDGAVLRLPDRAVAAGEPRAVLQLRDWAMFERTLKSGDIGFAESFIAGEWDSPDLSQLLRLCLANREHIEALIYGRWWGRLAYRLRHLLRRNSRAGSARNIHAHYDLGNDFYRLWLDPGMSYSAAWFEGRDPRGADLQQAQDAKYRRALREARVERGSRVLEIGCGWGGFAETVAKDYGASLYGVTLSREQLAYAQERIHKLGLDNLATFHFEDYRHIEGTFDHIGSIEMIEAVGEEHWPSYFKTLFDRLKPGGTAAIQAITIDEKDFEGYRSTPDFIQRYIFPGGMLLTKTAMLEQGRRVGLMLENVQNFRLGYAKTLRLWRERFVERWHEIQKLGFDETFKRKWIYYLSYCEAGFMEGSIDVGIYQYRKPAVASA